MNVAIQTERVAWHANRWNQLILGIIAMMAISSPQYVWTLFTGPLNQKLGTTLAELQWTFSLLIILQTWFSPFQAYLVDRFGPRTLISIGALLSGGSWIASAYVGQFVGALFHLRGDRRVRHRHHLCRHHRPDGALVSRSPRTGHRPCRRGLRLRRFLHQLSDRQHDQEFRLCPHVHRLGHRPGRDRRSGGAVAADATGKLSARERRAAGRRGLPTDAPQLFAAPDAAKARSSICCS